jgi:thiamine pyrophosphate-dependent acetolactate synthase large subunit-like protein
MTDRMTGADAFIETLIAAGVEWVFGNPGTTEQQFLHRLPSYPQLGFITALHESVAVAAAEGYARAAGKLGVVELHAGPGLGNAMGMLYNAAEGRTPLLVYVGQSARSGQYLQPTLSGDFVAQVHPLAKSAAEIRTVNEIPQVVSRAIKVAMTEPCGPVVVSIPMDLMLEEATAPTVPLSVVDTRVTPSEAALAAATAAISAAGHPVLLVGDGVAKSGALDEVGRLAQLLGAPVFGGFMSETAIHPDEPLNAGRLPSIDAVAAQRALQRFDLVIAVGTKLLSNVFTRPGLPLGSTTVVHVGLDPWELAKNHPSVVVFGDERLSLTALAERLGPVLSDRESVIAARRSDEIARITTARERALTEDRKRFESRPMTVERAAFELARALPTDAVIVDESLTGYAAVGRYLPLRPGNWFRLRGGGIGAGLPLSIGIQLARPGQRIVSVVGDGSAMYTLTAMWTAAHHRLPIIWVILNNASYRVLKENVIHDGVDAAAAQHLLGSDLTDPEIDFVALASGMGVGGRRVSDPAHVASALADALACHKPYLLDLAIDGQIDRK